MIWPRSTVEKSGEPSSPNFLSSVNFMVPLWVLRQVKPSLDVCALCRNLWTDWTLGVCYKFDWFRKHFFFFFLVQVSLLVAAFKLLAFLFCLGFSKLVLFFPVLGSWFDSSSWFFEIFPWDFCFYKNIQNLRWLTVGIHLKRSVRLSDGCWEAAWVD